MSIRSRISIPGGTCEFDLPAYYAWQQQRPGRAPRRPDAVDRAPLMPLAEALQVLLGLLRDSGVPQRMVAPGRAVPAEPARRQDLPPAAGAHWTTTLGLVPEISGHRLMVSVRLMRADAEGRLQARSRERPAVRTDLLLMKAHGAESDDGMVARARHLPGVRGRRCSRRQPLAPVLQRALREHRPRRLGQRGLPRARPAEPRPDDDELQTAPREPGTACARPAS